jgi:arsenate reductase (thioredoxin)
VPTSAEELALLDTDTVLGRAAERLADRYTGIFSPETVDRVVHESYVALYRTARVALLAGLVDQTAGATA